MARRIPELVLLTAAGTMPDDLFVVFDSDLEVTKKITRKELAAALLMTGDDDGGEGPVFGTMAIQNADAVAIIGGAISGVDLSDVDIVGSRISASEFHDGLIRDLAADLAIADGGTGASTPAGARVNLGAAAAGVNGDITALTGLVTDIAVSQGGTGASDAAGARSNLGAASRGANSDITSLTGLTTPLSVAQGGTGVTSYAALAAAMGALAVVTETLQANNGNLQLSNGFTIKWGKYQPTSSVGPSLVAMSFTPPFNSACYGVYPVPIAGADAWVEVQKDSVTATGWTCKVQSDNSMNDRQLAGWYWIAIGK